MFRIISRSRRGAKGAGYGWVLVIAGTLASTATSPTPNRIWSPGPLPPPSPWPCWVRDYRPRLLVQEVADLIVAVGAGSAVVAGHDWGGGLAWLLAMQHPERVERLVVLNAPHPIRFLKGLRSPRQLRRSWYILAFQAPWLPERLVAARDFRALRRALGRQPTRPGAF